MLLNVLLCIICAALAIVAIYLVARANDLEAARDEARDDRARLIGQRDEAVLQLRSEKCLVAEVQVRNRQLVQELEQAGEVAIQQASYIHDLEEARQREAKFGDEIPSFFRTLAARPEAN